MQTLTDIFSRALSDAVIEKLADAAIKVSDTIDYTEPVFGHMRSNIALRTAKDLAMSPMDLATQLTETLSGNENFSSVVAISPGFINVRFTDQVLRQYLKQLGQNINDYCRQNTGELSDKTMVIDYSHPNIGKPMGVHHLLSTVIGDALKRMYRGVGTTVIADNFIGDIGTQFGKLIHAVKTWGDLSEIEKNPIPELLKLYVQFHIESESDVELDHAARAEFRKLEQGDVQNRALWEKIVTWSKAEIQPIYDELDISFDYMHGESFYEAALEPIIKLGIKRGIFVQSQGALVYHMQNPDLPPAIIRKKDGATLYLTRDLARIQYWEKTWHPDLMVVVVDAAQSLHFRQVFEVAQALKLTNAPNIHVGFGRMKFADSSMSTRKGNILLLHDLIAESKKQARVLVAQKAKGLSEQEQVELAGILAIAALKYNILSQNRQSDITFDWGKMLSFEGNSAPYLLYNVVRAESVRAKGGDFSKHPQNNGAFNEYEQNLVLQLSKFPIVLSEAVTDFRPSTLCTYLFGLAQLYSSFYGSVELLTDGPERVARLQINQLFIDVMRHGLDMLGLQVPSKM